MTKEKAIEVLENGAWWDLLIPITTIEGRKLDIELHEALDIAIAALRNGWISVEDRLPEEFEVVLCIVNGKPETNITLRNAYQLGSWNKTEGWIIEEYPVWENAVVSWWQPLPEPPEED